MQTKTQNNNLKIISTNNCPSLSGKSDLKYQVKTDDTYIHLQLISNSNSGFFNSEPIKLNDIMDALAKVSDKSPITSVHLSPIFHGSSTNTAGFYLAILRDLDLVVPVEGKVRSHKLNPDYQNKINAIAGSGGKRAVRKKAVRKKASSRASKSA